MCLVLVSLPELQTVLFPNTFTKILSRNGEVATRLPHKQKNTGANPVSASKISRRIKIEPIFSTGFFYNGRRGYRPKFTKRDSHPPNFKPVGAELTNSLSKKSNISSI